MASVRSELDRPANELTGFCSASETSGAPVWLESHLGGPLCPSPALRQPALATLVIEAVDSHITTRPGANPWPGRAHTSAWGHIVTFCFFFQESRVSPICVPFASCKIPRKRQLATASHSLFFFFLMTIKAGVGDAACGCGRAVVCPRAQSGPVCLRGTL